MRVNLTRLFYYGIPRTRPPELAACPNDTVSRKAPYLHENEHEHEHACLYTCVCVQNRYIYKYTCVRVQNRALLNARRANDYTILEQLVDEIIVISDPLFIDSSVSWWSFWRHLIMEIRVQPKPIITETIHPLLSQLRVLIQLTGKYAWPGNRKTIQVHSHVFEMLNIFLHACM